MIKDKEIAKYPEWTRITEYHSYVPGFWTRKGAFVYAILEAGPGYSCVYSNQLIRRYSNGKKVIGVTRWKVIEPFDYERFFAPGEIDRLIMEIYL